MNYLTKIRAVSFLTLIMSLVLGLQALWGAERVTIKAGDGFPLAALYVRGNGDSVSKPAVVLLHMFKSHKESWQPLVTELKKHGISSLAVDLRGHGQSRDNAAGVDQSFRVADRDHHFFNQMYQDGLAAVAWLRSRGHHKIGVVGASVGCSVAMHMVAAAKPDISAVVLMTPGRNYLGIDTMGHLDNWPGLPLLILTSEEEAERGAEDIYKRLQNRGAQLVVFEEESIHGTNMFGEVDGVETRIRKWLSEELMHRGPTVR